MIPDSALLQHLPTAISLRHRLHQIPELAYEEHKTAAAIRAELDKLHIPCIPGLPGVPTATIALIGDTTKPCIALRADVDALPITERTGLAYQSNHPGRMHACGHDGHSACLVGVAAILQSLQDRLPVCVKLLWQPAEEGGGGAEKLVAAGVLEGVQAIFGLHGWPGMKVGTVATTPGPMLAATDNFIVTFIGRGCHGGYPHLGRDPIVAACEAVSSIQGIVSREIDPTEPVALTVGQINGGTAVNIIPDEAWFSGTVRTLREPIRSAMRQALERRCAGVAAAAGCTMRFDWTEGYPPTINDPAMADYVGRTAREALGPDRFIPIARPSMGGEDFSYYLEKVPGCFFLIGLEPADRNSYPSLHSDQFDFTDAALPTAIRMFVELVKGTGFDLANPGH